MVGAEVSVKSKKDGPLKISNVGDGAVLKLTAIICEAKERRPLKDLK